MEDRSGCTLHEFHNDMGADEVGIEGESCEVGREEKCFFIIQHSWIGYGGLMGT